MNWAIIWSEIQNLLKGLKNKDKWKVSIDGDSPGPITAVSIKQSGIAFEFDDNGTSRKLEAIPGSLQHATIKLGGVPQPNARLVFSLKHQIAKPLIVVFEFKGVTVNGAKHRYRFDNPK